RRRHTRWPRDWSSDVCSSDLDCDAMFAAGERKEPAAVHDGPGRDRPVDREPAADRLQRPGVDELQATAASQQATLDDNAREPVEIGRASCRERGKEGEVAGAA